MNKKQNKPDSFTVFALICLGLTLLGSIIHEMIFTWSK